MWCNFGVIFVVSSFVHSLSSHEQILLGNLLPVNKTLELEQKQRTLELELKLQKERESCATGQNDSTKRRLDLLEEHARKRRRTDSQGVLTRSEFSKLKEKDQKDSYDLDLKTYTAWQDGWTKLMQAGQKAATENELQKALGSFITGGWSSDLCWHDTFGSPYLMNRKPDLSCTQQDTAVDEGTVVAIIELKSPDASLTLDDSVGEILDKLGHIMHCQGQRKKAYCLGFNARQAVKFEMFCEEGGTNDEA